MWLREYPSLRSSGEGEDEGPETDTLLDFVMGIYILERVGIGHECKEEVITAISKCTIEDLYDLEPSCFFVKPLPVADECMPITSFVSCLSSAFVAAKTGINIHIEFSGLLKLLPTFRPYDTYPDLVDGVDDEDFDEYADTVRQRSIIFLIVLIVLLIISND
jgi:hypothetical protein